MIKPNLDIPEPSQFVSFKTVDSLALKLIQKYRSENKNKSCHPLDCERLADWLDLSIYLEDFNEPEGATFFAGLTNENGGTIHINENHREFFDLRPDVYSICIGHEIGHAVLSHLDHFSIQTDTPLLSEKPQNGKFMLHSSSWFQYGLSKDEVEKRKKFLAQQKSNLVKKAFVEPNAYQELKKLEETFEPLWMFKQAEHFAKCICIPQDQILEIVEENPLTGSWGQIRQFAEQFGVSQSVMKSRLIYLQLIEIDHFNQPVPISQDVQGKLF